MPEIMKYKLRPYRCTVCGHEKEIKTNHEVSCFNHCEGCSWKGEGFGPAISIPAIGARNYRRFEFIQEEETDG